MPVSSLGKRVVCFRQFIGFHSLPKTDLLHPLFVGWAEHFVGSVASIVVVVGLEYFSCQSAFEPSMLAQVLRSCLVLAQWFVCKHQLTL